MIVERRSIKKQAIGSESAGGEAHGYGERGRLGLAAADAGFEARLLGRLNRCFVQTVAETREHAHLSDIARAVDRELNAHLALHTGGASLFRVGGARE